MDIWRDLVSEDAVKAFLDYGHRDGAWASLTSTDLVRAFEICARQAPIETYDAAQKLYPFLPEERIAAIRTEIFSLRLTCDDLSVAEFLGRSLEERIKKLRARPAFSEDDNPRVLAHFVRLAVDTAFDLPNKTLVEAYLDEIFPKFERADTAVVFRNARAALRPPVDFDARDEIRNRRWIINKFDAWLDQRGDVFLGTVVEGRHRGEPQMQVSDLDVTYVHDRRAHRGYIPKAGDQVLIRPAAARPLIPNKVYCVAFLPVAMTASDF